MKYFLYVIQQEGGMDTNFLTDLEVESDEVRRWGDRSEVGDYYETNQGIIVRLKDIEKEPDFMPRNW